MQVKVEKYKGERELEKGLAKMMDKGWAVQTQASRKRAFRLATGLFTRQQIHTVTFVKA
jgi:hypothetical protein